MSKLKKFHDLSPLCKCVLLSSCHWEQWNASSWQAYCTQRYFAAQPLVMDTFFSWIYQLECTERCRLSWILQMDWFHTAGKESNSSISLVGHMKHFSYFWSCFYSRLYKNGDWKVGVCVPLWGSLCKGCTRKNLVWKSHFIIQEEINLWRSWDNVSNDTKIWTVMLFFRSYLSYYFSTQKLPQIFNQGDPR